jgi:16S rRNA (guanine527-N7)-methyltransferase
VSPPPEPAGDAVAAARARLVGGASALGLALTPAQVSAFERYAAEVRAGKQEASLTTLTDPVDIAVKHFLDSLAVLPLLPESARRVVDVGTGAGFPGVPLKLARPELELLLIEATAKKARWVERTLATLGVEGVEVVAGRAEDVAHEPRHRARYDAAVSRAVAPLPVLCELCLPFLRQGGTFVALKSAAGAAVEVPGAARALEVLGAALREVRPVTLADLPNRVLVVIEQRGPVPERYPRRAGMPAKRPL